MDKDDLKLLAIIAACLFLATIGLHSLRDDSSSDTDDQRVGVSDVSGNKDTPTNDQEHPFALSSGNTRQSYPIKDEYSNTKVSGNGKSWLLDWMWPKDFWQTIFNGSLVIVGFLQWRVYHRQFITAHRPLLRVRNFYINLGDVKPEDPDFTGQFYVTNIGDTDAIITESHVIIDWRGGGLPMKRPYEGAAPNNWITRRRLKAGDSYPVVFGGILVVQDVNTIRSYPETTASIMGFIDYVNEAGTRRRTAFCRTYDLDHKRFMKSDNQDYEHEE